MQSAADGARPPVWRATCPRPRQRRGGMAERPGPCGEYAQGSRVMFVSPCHVRHRVSVARESRVSHRALSNALGRSSFYPVGTGKTNLHQPQLLGERWSICSSAEVRPILVEMHARPAKTMKHELHPTAGAETAHCGHRVFSSPGETAVKRSHPLAQTVKHPQRHHGHWTQRAGVAAGMGQLTVFSSRKDCRYLHTASYI